LALFVQKNGLEYLTYGMNNGSCRSGKLRFAPTAIAAFEGGLDLGGCETTLPKSQTVGHVPRGRAAGDEHAHKALLYVAEQEKPRVWLQGKRGALTPGQALVLLAVEEGEMDQSPAAYRTPLRRALIDDKPDSVRVVLCATDYEALKRGIEHLPPSVQEGLTVGGA
jgi:hypothetical protein